MPTFDFARPFQFIFEDPAWMKKVLMGALFMFLGILTFFLFFIGAWPLFGYQVRVARQVADGDDTTLPEWNVGEDFGNGFKMLLISFLYQLPGGLIYGMGIGLGAVLGGKHGDNPIGGIMALGGMCIGMPLMLVGGIMGFIGAVHFMDVGELGAAFRIGEVFSLLKNNVMPLLLAIVVGMIAGLGAEIAGFIACGIGIFATMPIAMMIIGHAYGQVIRIDRARSGTSPSPAVPSAAGAY